MITGGAGFIGSHVVCRMVKAYRHYRVIVLDALTYAGDMANLSEVSDADNFVFVKGDIADRELVTGLFDEYDITGVIHLAAESHVDRSIDDPLLFARTNVMGTLTLLDAARKAWSERENKFEGCLFYHISTDEVYGALELDAPEKFTEETPYSPHSPYSASKAASDHFVRAYHDTYGLPTIVTNCSNNYGPGQYPEKLIPLFVTNIALGKPLPVYGEGLNVRDWLYVKDHASAIDLIFHRGVPGRSYNIGGDNEMSNIDLVRRLVSITDELLGREPGASEHLITHVTDRPGHDLRYAIDATRLRTELGWRPEADREAALRETVASVLATL